MMLVELYNEIRTKSNSLFLSLSFSLSLTLSLSLSIYIYVYSHKQFISIIKSDNNKILKPRASVLVIKPQENVID